MKPAVKNEEGEAQEAEEVEADEFVSVFAFATALLAGDLLFFVSVLNRLALSALAVGIIESSSAFTESVRVWRSSL